LNSITILGYSIQIGYVLKHPLRTYRSVKARRMQAQILDDIDRSASKPRHPAYKKVSQEYREEVAEKDAANIQNKIDAADAILARNKQRHRGRK
jgi:hypothetical protein